jgi:hypothetical protein
LPGDLVYWKDIEAMGIQLHQARVLYDEHFLSWKPEYPMRVSPLQLAELKFLYGIRFKTGIGVEMMRTMLSQLVKPYYYNSNCIYWHFEEARWKYFPQPAPIVVERVVEKDVEKVVEVEVYRDKHWNSYKSYYKDGYYRVDDLGSNSNSIAYKSNPDEENYFKLSQCDIPKKVVRIKEGDVLKFVKKRTPGRPKKNNN